MAVSAEEARAHRGSPCRREDYTTGPARPRFAPPYDAAVFRGLIRTFRGPSRDPRMAYISRPLPRDLPDDAVVQALDVALRTNPDPSSLVETLPSALKQVTGRDLQVLDRSSMDVTGRFVRRQVMIRDGDVGRWRGYAANAYPLIAPKREDDN